MQQIARSVTDRVVVAKANCGVPLYQDGVLAYPATSSDMADYVDLALRSGARIIGACCGSSFDHIAEIRQATDELPVGDIPTDEEIVARLGGELAAARRPERRRRRRSPGGAAARDGLTHPAIASRVHVGDGARPGISSST